MKSSAIAHSKRLLILFLKEPIAGKVHKLMSSEVGEHEAHLRYQAQVSVLVQQLAGLEETNLRICYAPHDAGDSIRFWLLPQLGGQLRLVEPDVSYHFTPNSSCQSHYIDFVAQAKGSLDERLNSAVSQAQADGYETIGIMGTNAIECGSRWVNMAMMLCEKTNTPIHGETEHQSIYLSITPAEHTSDQPSSASLPPLKKIQSDLDWLQALDSPLGAKLKKAHKKLTGPSSIT